MFLQVMGETEYHGNKKRLIGTKYSVLVNKLYMNYYEPSLMPLFTRHLTNFSVTFFLFLYH